MAGRNVYIKAKTMQGFCGEIDNNENAAAFSVASTNGPGYRVEISKLILPEDWPNIAAAIARCMHQMELSIGKECEDGGAL